MTGRINTLWRILEKRANKLTIKSQNQKNVVLVNLFEHVQKFCFFGSCDFNFNFLEIFSKMRQSSSTLPRLNNIKRKRYCFLFLK